MKREGLEKEFSRPLASLFIEARMTDGADFLSVVIRLLGGQMPFSYGGTH